MIMNKRVYILLFLFLPLGILFGQTPTQVVINGDYVVLSGGTSSKPAYIVVNNSNTNAILSPSSGWIISENEFNMVQWNIGTATGTYVIPFGYSTVKYLPLTFNISSAGTGSGVIKFSTYHTIADQYTGTISSTGDPSDVTNLTPFILPGSPSNIDNSYNIADRFYIIDVNTGYSTKPSAGNIIFSYISGTGSSEVASPNILTESRLMAERFNSGSSTWSDWFGKGCTDAVVSNVGTVQTGTVPAIDMYRSWALWDNLAPLPITISSTNILCSGYNTGSAVVTISGGVTPYTYSWSPSGGNLANASGLSAGSYTVTVNDKNGCTSTASISITQPASALGVTIASQTNLLCNGATTGSATANAATGGISPYTYNWSPSGGNTTTASNLSAGTYTITTTDNNGCTATASVIITQPITINISTNVTANVPCTGTSIGSVSSTTSGGISPYTYLWSDGNSQTTVAATGLSAGTYSVLVTDNNGCTATASANVTQIALRDSIASYTNVCSGSSTGTATVGVKYGTSPYTYLWSAGGQTTPTATGLSAGTYSVNVTDNNGCTATASVVISYGTLSVSVNTSAPSICPGECATLSVTISGGTGPFSYAWLVGGGTESTDSVCPTSKTTYSVNVTDTYGCSASASILAIITFSVNHCIVFH
jgi:hypothetical protein